ncbi:MAG: glycerol-3-phosphate 1-O-acyltransferase PlsY [bacterium]|nr:glycerol-3-phosphate 1-O-acyltransferase PlsY [bacterium]
MVTKWIFISLISYLIGSIPFGLLLGRLKGVDVRNYGSGNIGFANVYRVAGTLPGIITLILDIGKGVLSVFLAPLFCTPGIIPRVLCGIAVILGHVFSVFLKGRGGKGVATSCGVLIALIPVPTIIAILIFILVVLLSRYISLGAIIAAGSLPFLIYLFKKEDIIIIIFGIIIALIVLIRHISNIKRLIAGKEYRFGQRIKATDEH